MGKQQKHCIFIATILMLIALIATLKFDMEAGYYRLIPCFFGFMGGVYVFAAAKTNH